MGDRERDFCSLVGNDFPLFLAIRSRKSIPTSRALDPEYSRWWHFTMCRRWGFAETGESVWSIDHCYCCPCLLCVSQCRIILRKGETWIQREGWRCKAHLFNGDELNRIRIREICLKKEKERWIRHIQGGHMNNFCFPLSVLDYLLELHNDILIWEWFMVCLLLKIKKSLSLKSDFLFQI